MMPKEVHKVTTGAFETTPRMKELVNQVLDSGRISYGEVSKQFEREFASIHQSKYATLSNSGTSSLHVALQAMKELHLWSDGDEVIVPATTFVATANIVKHVRMRPVFVDIEMDTYGIDPKLIKEKITDRTRVIIPVHLFGQPCNMTKVLKVAKKYGLKVIEDSCEAVYVRHKKKPVGSMGDIGCFSMYVAHLITAGVGGISITNNPEYSAKMRSLVNHGLSVDNLNLDEHYQPQRMLDRKFFFDATGHSFRITEFEASLGLAQLDTLEDMIKSRNTHARHYTASLKLINSSYKDAPFILPKVLSGNEHAFMMYPIVLNSENLDDKQMATDMLNKWGVETRDMLPILGQPAFSFLPQQDYPVSLRVKQFGFYVGCHQYLSVDDINHVARVLGSVAFEMKRKL